MTSFVAPILANMPPPNYRVSIPEGAEVWHQAATPLFLVMALVFGTWWLARFRTVQSSAGRAVFLALVGFVATTYTAWWIWTNRIDSVPNRDFSSVLAVEMPFLYFGFSLLFSLTAQWRVNLALSITEPHRQSRWIGLLTLLVALGMVLTLVIALDRTEYWPLLFTLISSVALVIWMIVIAVNWCWARYGERAASYRCDVPS